MSFLRFNQIKLNKRFDKRTPGQQVFMSLDGVHFRIFEPRPFRSGWFSHKFNKAGLTYEIGLNIRTGDICWTYGGFCSGISDITMARLGLHDALPPNEKVIADKGYLGQPDRFITPPLDRNNPMSVHLKLITARHEVINMRMKHWNVMNRVWRHGWRSHNVVFLAVANLSQIRLHFGEPFPDPFVRRDD